MIIKIDLEKLQVFTKGGSQCAKCKITLNNGDYAYLCESKSNYQQKNYLFCEECQRPRNQVGMVAYSICGCMKFCHPYETVHYPIRLVEVKNEKAEL